MVETVKKAAAAGETLDISGKVGEVIEDIMYKMIFGRPSNSEDDNLNLKLLIKEISRLAGAFNLSDFVPCLAPLDLQLKKVSKILDKFMEKIIDEHEQAAGSNPEEQKPHRIFVHVMVSLLDKPMNPHEKEQDFIIDKTNIKAIMLDMISGALETSAIAIEWALSELLRHPRVMFGLQQELKIVVGRSRMVEESDLPPLTYLAM
ncbi:hypothetical protein QUC31_007134, partial [Theobroma cacao]